MNTAAEGQKRTRGEVLRGNPRYTDPPKLHGGDYLLDIVSEVGLEHAGSPITYQELRAWTLLSGVDLSPWESSTIREMSAAFCRWRDKSRDPHCEPPVYTENRTIEQIRRDTAAQVKEVFGRRAKGAKQ